MNERSQHIPGENPEVAEALINSLELGQLDPVFVDIIGSMEAVRQEFGVDGEIVRHVLDSINNQMKELGWLGGLVSVTGKIRPAAWDDDDETGDHFDNQAGIVAGEDERGRYYILRDYTLRFCAVSDDSEGSYDELSSADSAVFTLMCDDCFRDNLEDNDGNDSFIHDLLGSMILYPDEIEYVFLETPSLVQWIKDIAKHFPLVYHDILECIDVCQQDRHGNQLLAALKRLRWPVDERLREYLSIIGKVIYVQAEPESDVPYQFTIDGTLRTFTVDHKQAKTPAFVGKMTGYLAAIRFVERDGYFVPSYLIAEASHHSHDGFVGWQVEAADITKSHSTRPARAKLSQIALITLGTPADVADFWDATVVPCQVKRETIDNPGEPSGHAPATIEEPEEVLGQDADFSATAAALESSFLINRQIRTQALVQDYLDALKTNERVAGDINTICDTFKDCVAHLSETHPDGDYTLQDILTVMGVVEEAVTELNHLKIGDILLIKSPAMLASKDGLHSSLGAEATLVGRFISTSIGDAPSLAGFITNLPDEVTIPAVALVLESPLVFLPGGRISSELGQVTNVVLSELIPRVYRAKNRH